MVKQLPTLFKRSVSGKISQWIIEVEDNRYRTISGFVGMKLFESAWTECESKNVGKKNGTTPAEQALSQATSIWQKKIDLGAFDNFADVDKPRLFEPMLAHDYNDYRKKIKHALATQPKLDGIRCIINVDGMWTRKGKPIISAPHIWDIVAPLFEENPFLVLDGELFAERSSCDFNTIISCVRKTKPTIDDLKESAKYIQYWIYDVPSFEAGFWNRQIEYIRLVEAINNEAIIAVETSVIKNETEADTALKEYLEQDYEGAIFREIDSAYENKRSKNLLKYKNFVDAEFEIIDVLEGEGKLANRVGKLVFANFNAAVNGTHDYLAELWEHRNELIGKQATIKYFELTTDGAPRFPKVTQIDRFSYE